MNSFTYKLEILNSPAKEDINTMFLLVNSRPAGVRDFMRGTGSFLLYGLGYCLWFIANWCYSLNKPMFFLFCSVATLDDIYYHYH